MALHEIELTLKQHVSSCSAIGLPTPTGDSNITNVYNQEQDAQTRIQSLNPEQLEAFNRILEKVDNDDKTSLMTHY